MKTIKYLIIFTLSLFVLNSCGEEVDGTEDINFISFEKPIYNFGVDLDKTTLREVKVYTTQVTGADRTFNVIVDLVKSTADPAAYTVPATVTIPANSNVGLLPISVTDLNVGVAGKKLVLSFEPTEGLFTSEPMTLNITQLCQDQVFLKINFDNWASECSWKLFDASNVVLASGGSYKDGAASASTQFCLKNGTYTFTIYDSYGDGLTDPGLGNATVTYKGVALVSIPGNFGSGTSRTFTISN